MTDQEQWHAAVAAVKKEYDELTPDLRDRLIPLLAVIKTAKERVHGWAEGLNAGEICASCGGECCATGKHHFTVVDLLTHFVCGAEPIAPRFYSGRCPYLGDCGCMMEPGFRPYNCITFNCDRIDGLLDPPERTQFMEAERLLRSCYDVFERLFDNRFMCGLFINWERDVVRDGGSILRSGAAEANPQKWSAETDIWPKSRI